MAPRRLILCLDGTWNSTASQARRRDGHTVLKPSNVLKVSRAIVPFDPRDGAEQIAYYDVGVGSLARYPGIANRLLAAADRLLGGAWGAGFEGQVERALGFLQSNFQAGDALYLFGFSRGAAAAQALARFLDWSEGLPRKRDAYFLPRLFRAYVVSRGERPSAEVREEIARELERHGGAPLQPWQPIAVELLGVWDTVMALGSRFRAAGARTSSGGRSFHVGEAPPRIVRHARQALAIDEQRYDFRPEVWRRAEPGQTLEQRWFSGVHSNVGGGYVDDGLANVALHWLLDEARERGLAFDVEYLRAFRAYPQDRLYRSESIFYRLLDGARGRFGRGRRELLGWPPAARLTLSASAIHRLRADPAARRPLGDLESPRFPEMSLPYRPASLLRFLAAQPDLDAYLASLGLAADQRELPADVLLRLCRLRPQSSELEARA
jgi:uncharacterized protein (DUF2235 family)